MMNPVDPLNPGYWVAEELREFGFAEVGRNVALSRHCNIVGVKKIRIGSNVRIDFGVTIVAGSAEVTIGNFVHIGAYCYLSGGGGIQLMDFSGLSQRVSLYTSSDDYGGGVFTNPTVPSHLTRVKTGRISVGRHCIVGSGSVILPAVSLGEGSAIGSLSLVSRDTLPWKLYAGVPAKVVRDRIGIDMDGSIATKILGVEHE